MTIALIVHDGKKDDKKDDEGILLNVCFPGTVLAAQPLSLPTEISLFL